MVTAPSDNISLIAPVLNGGPLAINRAIDLPIHWTTAAGVPTGNVEVLLYSQSGAAPPQVAVTCTFPINSAGGMAVVPTRVLSTIPGGYPGFIQIGVADSAMVAAGDN